MEAEHILADLNKEQRSAVTAPPGHWLVLAGAGCGKTRVLVHRVAWHLFSGAEPRNVLAVTFTNKAAAEMRERILQLVDEPIGPLWAGTFHGIAHRILRLKAEQAGLRPEFQIIDGQDQANLLRQVLKGAGVDNLSRSEVRQLQGFINACKERAQRPATLQPGIDASTQWLRIYSDYQARCDREGIVDFAELLLRLHELLERNAEVRALYQDRFRCILVDEFQDTNALQYSLIRLLCGAEGQVFAVGDDDQSIYSWRGAQAGNMQRFTQEFSNCRLLRLERNYRSTRNILTTANSLIAWNSSRIGKELWTEGEDGENVRVLAAINEQDEARFVVEDIRQWHESGGKLSEAAVLYRVSALSRAVEEACLHASLPYRVRGGLRFYDRKEIKDVMAYLRLAMVPDDDMAFRRVVNCPPRGIGARTVETLGRLATARSCSLCQVAREAGELSPQAARRLADFLELLEELRKLCGEVPLREAVAETIRVSGLEAHYKKEQDVQAVYRLENLDELVNAASWFEQNQNALQDPGVDSPVMEFLTHAVLESGAESGDNEGIQLMTVHSAKGLEFERVYITGLEEGLFPHSLSQADPAQLEEERRLCYVGMTRAKRALTLCWSGHRMLHGELRYHEPSRFLDEIPTKFLQHVRPGMQRGRGMGRASPTVSFKIGQQVVHQRFGQGVVINVEGGGNDARLMVNFEHEGTKWLLVGHAPLWPVMREEA